MMRKVRLWLPFTAALLGVAQGVEASDSIPVYTQEQRCISEIAGYSKSSDNEVENFTYRSQGELVLAHLFLDKPVTKKTFSVLESKNSVAGFEDAHCTYSFPKTTTTKVQIFYPSGKSIYAEYNPNCETALACLKFHPSGFVGDNLKDPKKLSKFTQIHPTHCASAEQAKNIATDYVKQMIEGISATYKGNPNDARSAKKALLEGCAKYKWDERVKKAIDDELAQLDLIISRKAQKETAKESAAKPKTTSVKVPVPTVE